MIFNRFSGLMSCALPGASSDCARAAVAAARPTTKMSANLMATVMGIFFSR